MKHIIDDKLLLAFARKNPTISIFYLANALIDKNKKIPFIKDILDGNRIDTSVFDEVVGYLNSKTNKKFRAKTPATKRVINARLAEGFTVSDFKTVIDNQCRDWDTNMVQYLRPITLFGNKFESYLNNSSQDISNEMTPAEMMQKALGE